MKLVLSVPNKIIFPRKGVYSFEYEDMEVNVRRITRQPVGRKTKDRFYYRVDVEVPSIVKLLVMTDEKRCSHLVRSDWLIGDYISIQVNRKKCKEFKPPKEGWKDNTYYIPKEH